MKEEQEPLFTVGEFALEAGITQRTIRYYDKIGLLKPCSHNKAGHRLYSKNDFARLQKILTLKFIGLSLEEIGNVMKQDIREEDFKKSLEIQQKILEEKIHHMHMVKNAIHETLEMVNESHILNWEKFVDIINIINTEKTWLEQYEDASNLRARIKIHELFSTNQYGWMRWFFDQLDVPEEAKILELGCGDGNLWVKNSERIPPKWNITLTDFSQGMLQESKNSLENNIHRFNFKIADAQTIPFEGNSFDVVIANHMLYHVPNREKAFSEIERVLKPGGKVYASTVGARHMIEMRVITAQFDAEAIATTDKNLTESFQLENGFNEISKWFDEVKIKRYDDNLIIKDAAPLVDYIFSIPGNIKDNLDKNKLEEFIKLLEEKIQKDGGIHITKDTGFFEARKYTKNKEER